jgi:hypothetical protein
MTLRPPFGHSKHGRRGRRRLALSPAFRLLFDRGVRRHGFAVCGIGLAARMGVGSWILASPDARDPAWVASPGDARVARWYSSRGLGSSPLRRMLGPATMLCLESRDALRGELSR